MTSLSLFLFLLFGVWLIILTLILFWQYRKEQVVARAASEGRLPQLINENQEALALLEQEIRRIRQAQQLFDQELKSSLRKIGLVRYNAFEDMGGDLSFSLALMDEWGNGFIFSCLNGRSESRIYAKPLREGKSPYPLSKEEKEALAQARGVT